MTETAARLATSLGTRYRIERELGAGGMATVYLAQDLEHDRKVALKVFKPELARSSAPSDSSSRSRPRRRCSIRTSASRRRSATRIHISHQK